MSTIKGPIDEISRHLGSLIKGFPSYHHKRLASSLDVSRRTFMEKLVSPKILAAGVSLHYDCYLKGLLWLDYFTTILAGTTDLLDNLKYIKEEMGKKSVKPLVPGNLALVATGAWAFNLPEDSFRSAELEKRWTTLDEKSVLAGELSKVGPFYLALGAMVSSFASGWRREAIPLFTTRLELQALIFIDAVISLTAVPNGRQLVEEKKLMQASVEAVKSLMAYSTPDRLREHLEPALAGKKGL